MPPVITLGTTVRSVTRHVSTDGSSAMLLVAWAIEPSTRQFGVTMPSYRNDWLWPPYFVSSLKDAVSLARSEDVRCGPLSPFEGSPKAETSNLWFEVACHVSLPA